MLSLHLYYQSFFNPFRPVWNVPDQIMDYTILDNLGLKRGKIYIWVYIFGKIFGR